MIVVDASPIRHFSIRGPLHSAANRCMTRDPVWIAAAFWRIELCQSLVEHLQSEPVAVEDLYYRLLVADTLIKHAHEKVTDVEMMQLARDHSLTASQATIICIARKLDATLVTEDDNILAACPDHAANLEGFGVI